MHQIISVCSRNPVMGASNGLLFVCGRDKEGDFVERK